MSSGPRRKKPHGCGADPGIHVGAAMQALQTLAGSFQDATRDGTLRDKILDIPKRLLSRVDEHEENILGNVSGDFKYHFTFRLEGGGFFQTGVLVASAENMPGGLPLPLRCKWKRKIGDMLVEIPSVTSNMYQISADDVGTDICVEVYPADMDDGHLGTAEGQIGPFELDPSTRRALDNALGSGGRRFIVSQSVAPGERSTVRSDMAVMVSVDGVKIVPLQGGKENKSKETVADYSQDYPKVIIHPLDTCKFQLIMSATGTLHLQAQSRTARDLIALTIRCFHAKRTISTAGILQELFPVQTIGGAGAAAPADAGQNSHLDECIVMERLTKELNKAMGQKDMADKVLRNTHHEKKQLQAQLEETVRGFQDVILGLEDQCKGSSPSAIPATDLQKQLREMQENNRQIEGELQNRRKQFEDAQAAAAKRATGPGGSPQLIQQREKRDMLKIRLQELKSTSGQQRDQADQVHALELKRLRQEVEDLHNTKEDLRRQLQDTDRQNQELKQNYLYVKGQRDKVQVKHTQSMSGTSHEEKELARFREAVENITAERHAMSQRREGTQRELEKEKAYHESSVERLIAANAKLKEDRDRVEKEMQSLSQLYAASVEQVQQHQDKDLSGGIRMESMAEAALVTEQDREEVNQLKAQLAQVDESLNKREQENDSLKNRIRKLAVA